MLIHKTMLCVTCCHEEYECTNRYRSSLAPCCICTYFWEDGHRLGVVLILVSFWFIHDILGDMKWDNFFFEMVQIPSLFHPSDKEHKKRPLPKGSWAATMGHAHDALPRCLSFPWNPQKTCGKEYRERRICANMMQTIKPPSLLINWKTMLVSTTNSSSSNSWSLTVFLCEMQIAIE